MSVLTDIIQGASEGYQANQQANAADALAEAEKAKAAAASANATTSSNTTKWFLIGGGVLVVALIGLFAFRGKS